MTEFEGVDSDGSVFILSRSKSQLKAIAKSFREYLRTSMKAYDIERPNMFEVEYFRTENGLKNKQAFCYVFNASGTVSNPFYTIENISKVLQKLDQSGVYVDIRPLSIDDAYNLGVLGLVDFALFRRV